MFVEDRPPLFRVKTTLTSCVDTVLLVLSQPSFILLIFTLLFVASLIAQSVMPGPHIVLYENAHAQVR